MEKVCWAGPSRAVHEAELEIVAQLQGRGMAWPLGQLYQVLMRDLSGMVCVEVSLLIQLLGWSTLSRVAIPAGLGEVSRLPEDQMRDSLSENLSCFQRSAEL